MTSQFKSGLQRLLREHLEQRDLTINKIDTISGGSINDAYRIETSQRKLFFVKTNNAFSFPGMFEAEKKGLELLRTKSEIKIPDVVFSAEHENISFLVLEYIQSAKGNNNSSQEFGKLLAALHRNTCKSFGLDHNNYIGSLHQSNLQHASWIEFFIQERLSPLLKLAFDEKKITGLMLRNFEKMYKNLNSLMPSEDPALLHGDLWNGNYMTSENGRPCIFDPAVYYGHREADIAMTKLFGGFPEIFYEAYNDEFPLEKEWLDRVDLFNLYPILVHVNLFGGNYVSQAESILKRYT